jgi:diguanylate cyclase (GGDEF)-like protein
MHDDPGAALVIAEEPGLALAVLDALPDATAVLDYSGTIIAVNSAWRAFAFDNGGSATDTGPGVNYLKVCARSAATGDRDAADILGCLRAVLSGEAVECELEYPCDSPDEQRWFRARFTAIGAHGGAAVSSHVNISRRKRAELELVHRASYDPLTGLANRVLFIETLTEFLDCRPGRVLAQPDMAQPDIAQPDRAQPDRAQPDRAQPDRAQPDRVEPRTTHGIPAQVGTTRRVGLLYLGLDQFTLINDDFGHAVGDELLLATTRRLRQLVRDGDTVARLGGDEFAVCAPGITEDELTAMAERIGSALAEPHLVHGEQLRVGASLGVYLSAPGDTAAGAIHWADQAMYLVKNTRLPA